MGAAAVAFPELPSCGRLQFLSTGVIGETGHSSDLPQETEPFNEDSLHIPRTKLQATEIERTGISQASGFGDRNSRNRFHPSHDVRPVQTSGVVHRVKLHAETDHR